LTRQLNDGVFDNEDSNQDLINEVNIVDIGGFTTMDEDSCFDNVDVSKASSTPMDRALAYLHETMAKITMECTQVQVSNCATMQHHFFKELDQTFTTVKSTNPCT
jgi:hypothetical protein